MKTFFCLALLYVFSASQKVNAESVPHSMIELDFRETQVKAKILLPLKELENVFGKKLLDERESSYIKYSEDLNTYILSHIKVTGEDGLPWDVRVEKDLGLETSIEGEIQISAYLSLSPLLGKSPRRFVIYSDLIQHQISTHRIFVIVSSDWDEGVNSLNPEGVGVIYFNNNSLSVNRDDINLWRGFYGTFLIGLWHIAEGFDHLLFLLMLLLPAPLISLGGRWGRYMGAKHSLFQLVKIISAFTLGHTFSLLFAAAGWAQLPTRPVEMLIALSICLSAVHAIRPIFHKQEWTVAAVFGIIHGLAFSRILAEYDLSAGRLALSILGFNLGVEVMQLFVVLLFIPWFFIASGSERYNILRVLAAGFGFVAAFFWFLSLAFEIHNPMDALLIKMVANPFWVVAFTAMISLLVRASPGQKERSRF